MTLTTTYVISLMRLYSRHNNNNNGSTTIMLAVEVELVVAVVAIEVESLAQFDIGYILEAQTGKDVNIIKALIVCSSLIEETIHSQVWNYFACQTVDDIIMDDINDFSS